MYQGKSLLKFFIKQKEMLQKMNVPHNFNFNFNFENNYPRLRSLLELALPSKMIQRGSESNANKILAQEGNCSVNLASQGHCAGVFIGI